MLKNITFGTFGEFWQSFGKTKTDSKPALCAGCRVMSLLALSSLDIILDIYYYYY
jgi:hypothetical protein